MGKDLERRRYHRFLAMLDVRVAPDEGIPADLRLATIDLAVGGMRCASNHELEPGLKVQVGLTLVGGDLRAPFPIGADAKVLRCTARPGAPPHKRYEVALEFVRLDPNDQRRLQSYLNSL